VNIARTKAKRKVDAIFFGRQRDIQDCGIYFDVLKPSKRSPTDGNLVDATMKEGNGVEVLLIACYSLRFTRVDLIQPLEITKIEGLDRLVTSIVAREIHIPRLSYFKNYTTVASPMSSNGLERLSLDLNPDSRKGHGSHIPRGKLQQTLCII
jgi:hypothetical protein